MLPWIHQQLSTDGVDSVQDSLSMSVINKNLATMADKVEHISKKGKNLYSEETNRNGKLHYYDKIRSFYFQIILYFVFQEFH